MVLGDPVASDPVVSLLSRFCRNTATRTPSARELPVENVDSSSLSVPPVLSGGRVPVGDDNAAERVRRGQRHERERVQGGAPQVAIDPDPATAAAILTVTAEKGEKAVIAADCIVRPPIVEFLP